MPLPTKSMLSTPCVSCFYNLQQQCVLAGGGTGSASPSESFGPADCVDSARGRGSRNQERGRVCGNLQEARVVRDLAA